MEPEGGSVETEAYRCYFQVFQTAKPSSHPFPPTPQYKDSSSSPTCFHLRIIPSLSGSTHHPQAFVSPLHSHFHSLAIFPVRPKTLTIPLAPQRLLDPLTSSSTLFLRLHLLICCFSESSTRSRTFGGGGTVREKSLCRAEVNTRKCGK